LHEHGWNDDGRRRRADQVLDRGLVFNQGPVTWVNHHGYAHSRYDFEAEAGDVWAASLSDRCELAYLMVHARLGPLLEARGLVRVHGLGLVVNERAAVLLTPSGGGKSRLALSLLQLPEVRLLSDDIVLLDWRGRAQAFPMP